jgi:hypothetical protein
MSLIWTLTPLVALASAQLTNPSQLPGFSLLCNCAQSALVCNTCILSGVEGHLGCSNWQCVCNDFSVAVGVLSYIAYLRCYDSQYAASATSILSGFCQQFDPTPLATSSIPQTTIAPGQFAEISQWPGFSTLRDCAQSATPTSASCPLLKDN